MAQHPTKKHSERYLVDALYLRDHGHAAVNMDHMYTYYRTAGWPMTINDWDVNLCGTNSGTTGFVEPFPVS